MTTTLIIIWYLKPNHSWIIHVYIEIVSLVLGWLWKRPYGIFMVGFVLFTEWYGWKIGSVINTVTNIYASWSVICSIRKFCQKELRLSWLGAGPIHCFKCLRWSWNAHKNVFQFFQDFRAVWMSSRRPIYDCQQELRNKIRNI